MSPAGRAFICSKKQKLAHKRASRSSFQWHPKKIKSQTFCSAVKRCICQSCVHLPRVVLFSCHNIARMSIHSYRNSCKETHTFTGASWRKTSLECPTHATPADESFVLPMEKNGKDGSSKILANAAWIFSFSIFLLHSCCRVQLFLDDGDRCPGPTYN